MLLPLLGVAAGLALLTLSADQFVVGAARVAARLRLSTVVIGAVVIGFGTSAPEMVVSGIAAGRGSLDIAVGNIVGSNVANLSLVLGTAALVAPIAVGSPTLRREAPISLGAVTVFAFVVQGGLTRLEGALLAAGLVGTLWLILRASRVADREISDEVEDYLGGTGETSLTRESLRTVAGLAGTLAAAQLLVVAASDLAARAGLSEGFVGLTVVAIGTSLPELATSLQAARRGNTDLVIGNLLGSNLFNSLGVAAVAGLTGPGPVTEGDLTGLAVVTMMVVSVAATLFMVTGRRVVRWEGALLLIVYLSVLPALA